MDPDEAAKSRAPSQRWSREYKWRKGHVPNLNIPFREERKVFVETEKKNKIERQDALNKSMGKQWSSARWSVE